MARLFGYTEQLVDTDGAVRILGQSADYDGLVEVTVRAAAAGVFVSDANVTNNLPDSGFELFPDVDYKFVTDNADFRMATESVTPIAVTVFINARY